MYSNDWKIIWNTSLTAKIENYSKANSNKVSQGFHLVFYTRLIFVSTRANYSFLVEEEKVPIYGFVTAKNK